MTSRAVVLANLASSNILEVDSTTDRVGIGSTQPTTRLDVSGNIKAVHGNFTGVVTATSFVGDGSSLTGVANTNFIVGTAITMTTGTFNGPVTIGGTLTYEDVTNIDSVGVITARSDVSIADKIVHTNDTNTAIRFPAADTFTVETGGNERFRIVSDGGTTSSNKIILNEDGNLGISETSPTDFLHILPTDGKGITLKTTANHSAQITADCNRSAADNTILAIRGNWNGTGAAEIALTTGDDTANKDDGKILFKTSGSSGNVNQRMEINRLGQLLINSGDSTFNSRSGFFNDNGGSSTAVQIEGSIYAYSSMSITRNGSGASGPAFIMAKGQGGTTIINDNDTMGQVSFQGAEGTGDMVEGAKIIAEVDGSPASNNMPGRLAFYTNSGASTATERFRIDSSGRMLIGATSSAGNAILTVQGLAGNTTEQGILAIRRSSNNGTNAKIGVIEFSGGDNNQAAIIQAVGDNTWGTNDYPGRLEFYTTADGASTPTERLRIDSAGRLIIGSLGSSAQPASGSADDIVIAGTGNRGITINSTNSSETGIFFADGTSGSAQTEGQVVYFHSNNNMSFATSNSYKMRILSDGELQIYDTGSTSFNIANSNGAGTSNILIYGQHSSSNLANGTASFIVYTNGNVQNTNDSYGQISDIKLKENIVDVGSQWEDFKAVRFRKYNFKEETGHETHTQLGVIAQELELTSPGLVYETSDKDVDGNDLGTTTKAVKSSILTKKALVALQEAMTRIETLETKVTALEG